MQRGSLDADWTVGQRTASHRFYSCFQCSGVQGSHSFTTFYANVKFLKHFSYDVNLNYKDYRYESMSVNTDYGKYRDVYKRQALERYTIRLWTGLCESKEVQSVLWLGADTGIWIFGRLDCVPWYIPVSYTHLDVYKRQVFWLGGYRLFQRWGGHKEQSCAEILGSTSGWCQVQRSVWR